MLRSFYIENWKSFREPALFSMVATREQRDGETLAKISSPRSRFVPITALYGANAAGKSGLVEALGSFRQIVLGGRSDTARLPVSSCKSSGLNLPVVLEVEILTQDRQNSPQVIAGGKEYAYRYTVTATSEEIIDETLVRIRPTFEQLIYTRNDEDGFSSFDDEQAKMFAATVGRNETILRRLTKQRSIDGLKDIRRVYDWFENTLRVLRPDSVATRLPARIHANDIYKDAMSRELSTADTGILGIEFRQVSIRQVDISSEELEVLEEELGGYSGVIITTKAGRVYLLNMGESGIVAQEMVTVHKNIDDPSVSFYLSLDQESDGTVRFLNLLPMLLDLANQDSSFVYVVDELDRSIHTGLIGQVLQRFLDGRSAKSRSQLIFTTHNASLLRMGILRRDEVWFVAKSEQDSSANGSSELIRLSELARWGIRDNTDLFNSYLAGILPGTPRSS